MEQKLIGNKIIEENSSFVGGMSMKLCFHNPKINYCKNNCSVIYTLTPLVWYQCVSTNNCKVS